MTPHVVIAGGGFGGFHAARSLERSLPPDARITLVNDVNFLLWTPLLPGTASGALEPRHAVVGLREHLERTELRLGRVCAADPGRRELTVATLAGDEETVSYDQLVVAVGSISKTLPIPGLDEHGIGLKTLAEGVALRNRLLRHLELAETLDAPEARAPYLTFVFVGGGYAGVEGLAELQDLALDVLADYPRCRAQGTRWLLVEAQDDIMGEVHPRLGEYTARELRRRGIDVRTGTTVEAARVDAVELSDGETVPTRTLVWTAGVQPQPVVERLGLPLDHGRIAVDAACRVPGFPEVWALGDAAAVPDPAQPGRPCPPTAQHAVRQGRLVGRNVAAALAGESPRPFRYRSLGLFVDLGRRRAVGETLGVRWRGLPAWALARAYHLATLPGARRRARLLIDWTLTSAFGRDTIELGQPAPGLGELEAGEQSASTGRFAREGTGQRDEPGVAGAEGGPGR